MRIVMIEVGYVGLMYGACFADLSHDVSCIDKDTDKIAALDLRNIYRSQDAQSAGLKYESIRRR